LFGTKKGGIIGKEEKNWLKKNFQTLIIITLVEGNWGKKKKIPALKWVALPSLKKKFQIKEE